MKKFCLVSLVVAGLCVGGCTPTDRFFGNDMIPPSQELTTRVDTVTSIATYQVTFDSISARVVGAVASPTTPLGYMGSVIDPLVGRTTMGTIANFVPDAYTKNKEWRTKMFGLEPTVDSMKLSLAFASSLAIGDTTKKIKVSVYTINKRLYASQPYVTCTDPAEFYDPAQEPLIEFMTNGVGSVDLKLPQWYAEQFITPEYNQASENNPYLSDSIFLDVFKGFYFRAEHAASGERGVIGALSLNLSELRIHFHNKEEQPTDTTLGYYFYYAHPDDPRIYYTPQNTSMVLADHDYSLATDPRGVDPSMINNLSVECPTIFVQGLGGLAGLAKIDLSVLDRIKEKALALGYRYVGVHRAELRWRVPERTLFYYDDSFSLLVLTNWVSNTLFGFTPLPDYNPWDEMNGANAMGGKLVRSTGCYSQNITSYVQHLLTGSNKNGDLFLSPDFGGGRDNLDPLRSVVGGSAGPKELRPELVITYTLVR